MSRTGLHDQLVRNLALRILRGKPKELAPILTTETVLARHLKVSRNALREALKVLAAKGMVEVRTRTGIHIRSKSEWNLLDLDLLLWQCEVGVDEKFARNLCQIRQLLEPWAAETAALQATDQEIESLCHAYDKMVQSEGLGEDKAYDDADIEFHRAIGRASHNDFLVRINDNIFAAMGFISGVLKQRGQRMTSAAITQHGAVAEAIRKRNPEEARAAMVELVKYAEQSAYAAIRRELPERSALKPGQDSNVSGF